MRKITWHKNSWTIIGVLMLLISCAKIPSASITLMEAVEQEGERMHHINVALVNSLFDNKNAAVNEVIDTKYTPRLIENFKKIAPADFDYKAKFADVVQGILPSVNATRDSLQTVLNDSRKLILDKLDSDYSRYRESAAEIRRLLQSAVKLDNANRELVSQTSKLTNTKLDVDGIEKTIDKFILSGGNIGEKAVGATEAINKFLNK